MGREGRKPVGEGGGAGIFLKLWEEEEGAVAINPKPIFQGVQ